MDTIDLQDIDLNRYKVRAPNEVSFVKRNAHAKKFVLSKATAEKIYRLWRDHPGLYEDQRQFAKPPFPACYVEFTHGSAVIGLLWAEGRTVMLTSSLSGAHLGRITVDVLESGLLARDQRPKVEYHPDSPKKEMVEQTVTHTALVEILWLLMHRPGVITTRANPDRKTLTRTGLKTYRAHTVLTIDLAEKDLAKTITADGSRGSGVREHEVRGTWVHLYHVRSCTHQWSRVDRPAGAAERWTCPCCGTMRVWRKDHVRGEHKRGNKFHTYHVKDSNLEDE